MDWKKLEIALFESARRTLENLLAQGVEPLYGAAFHSSYREEEYIIDLPCFGANSLAALDEDHPGWHNTGFHQGVKWNPADWRWNWEPSAYGTSALTAMHEDIQAFANRNAPAQWVAAEARFVTTVARAAASLGRHFAKDPRVCKDFVVFFHDESGGADLARVSMSHALFMHHFPDLDTIERTRREVAMLPETEQAAFYIERLGELSADTVGVEEAETWLVAHGAVALPWLVDALQRGSSPWRAARILGLTGIADPAALRELRRQMLEGDDEPTRLWCARALGYLKDFDWLLTQPIAYAVEGCCANLRAFREKGAQPTRLEYTPLEHLLSHTPKCAAMVEDALRPGSHFCGIGVADVAEALRGVRSPHVAIRRHAACVLNNRRLGKANTAKILATLKGLPHDPDEVVRRCVERTRVSLER
jgi:hypothetical protein